MALQLQKNGIWVYCASAWSGFYSAVDRERLDPFIRRCKRLKLSVMGKTGRPQAGCSRAAVEMIGHRQ